MTRIVVIGGTGYAGAAIVTEAASRGHDVVSFSRGPSAGSDPRVRHVAGDATDQEALQSLIDGAEVVVGALAPRGPIAGRFREIYRTIAELADDAGAALYVVGGFSSLRPAPGAPRFVTDLRHAPAQFHDELIAVSALVTTDLPATPDSLDWVFVSPAGGFGAHVPGERLGRYRVGDDVAVSPEDRGAISGEDFALGFVDLIEQRSHHRTQLNLAH